MTISGLQVTTLVVIALLGHAMALAWTVALRSQWPIVRRAIYDLSIEPSQMRRELRNSLHAPIHGVILFGFVALGYFANRTLASFAGTLLLAAVWAELWHYASHRAFHLRSLHKIHAEHHRSRLNTPFTAISFSFSEKLIFDLGHIGALALVDSFVTSLDFYGIAAWYVGYLVVNSFSHANFEIKSRNFNRFAGRLLTTTTYHSLHHARYRGNYGLGTRILDRLFGTECVDYERVYDSVAQNRPLTGLAEKIDAERT